jgi:divalent metal cation (Fe/Co/Zn/Cd) transporter
MAILRAEVRAGVRAETFSVIWMVLEAIVSIGAGIAAKSVLLTAFGIDSVIELITAGIVLWRLSVEERGGDLERVKRAERQATGVTAIALVVLCLYVFVAAIVNLLMRRSPESSPVGIGVSVAAVIVMPWLGVTKRSIAERLNSASLRADAASSLTCGYLAGTVLLGLALSAAFHWWWVEGVAALAFLYWLIGETREALEEARGGESGEATH